MTAFLTGALGEDAARRLRAGASSAAVWLGALAAAFLAARGTALGLHPLGVALAGAVPASFALPVCAGAALGYASFPPLASGAPYLASILAVAAVRAVCGPRRRRVTPLAPAALGSACLALCASGMAVVTGAGASGVLLAVSESLMALGASFLLAVFFSLRSRGISDGDSEASAARLFALAAAVVALMPLSAGAASAGILFASAASFAAALRGEGAGAAAGAVCAAALAASDATLLYAGVGIALGAVAAGLCRDAGHGVSCAAFALASLAGAAVAPGPAEGFVFAAQTVLAALIVSLLPRRFWRALTPVPRPDARGSALEASERLDGVARALCSAGDTISAVCARLPRKSETMDDVCDEAVRRVCARCRRRAACWTSGSPDAFDAFNALAAPLRRTGSAAVSDLPGAFRAACGSPDRLCAAVTSAYQAQLARKREALRADAARASLAEQYGALAEAVAHVAADVALEELPDRRRAERLERLFTELGAPPLETCVTSDGAGGVRAVVRLPRMEFTRRELAALSAEASAVCRCPFETASPRAAGAQTILTLRRRRAFDAVFGCSAAAAADVSADVFRTAEDGRGRVHAILCDGMGTGRAAAVDGSLAAALLEPLLCAGAGAEAAARLAGVALSLKGGGDEPVAVDVLSVDLYTGRARLYKAGGAPSFLIRAGEVTRVGGDSLPIGGGRAAGRAESLDLREGDRLLLVSDGVTAAGEQALAELLAHKTRLCAQALCEAVVDAARAASGRPDDITAACLELRPLVRAV